MSETKHPYSTIDEYIAQCAPEAQPMMRDLRAIIREVAPECTEKISWGMPTFVYLGNLIHFAAAKKHIGLFPGAAAVEAFAEKLEGYESSSSSVGTVRLPLNKPLPAELVREIVAFCVAENIREDAEKRAKKESSLESLPNMGKVLAHNLRAVGIETPAQLREAGVKDAFLRIRAVVDPGACIQMLYGLQGAVEGVRDTLLPAEVKADLRAFFQSL